MSIRGKLQRILYENVELTEDELFEQAVQQELDAAVGDAIGDELTPAIDQVPDKTPEEKMDEILPQLVGAFEHASDPDKDNGKVKIMMTIYKDKAESGVPIDNIIRNMSKHFNMDAKLQGKVEDVFRSFTGEEVEEPAPNQLVEEAKKYLEKTGRTTALRSLIEEQLADDNLQIFAGQLLTSQSWYRGDDYEVVEGAFSDMIKSVKNGEDLMKAVVLATQRIQQTYD